MIINIKIPLARCCGHRLWPFPNNRRRVKIASNNIQVLIGLKIRIIRDLAWFSMIISHRRWTQFILSQPLLLFNNIPIRSQLYWRLIPCIGYLYILMSCNWLVYLMGDLYSSFYILFLSMLLFVAWNEWCSCLVVYCVV